MKIFYMQYFGELDYNNLEPYYMVKVELLGREILLDLNFDQNQINEERLFLLKNFLENIGIIDKNNRRQIENDFFDINGEASKLYMEHHLQEVDKESWLGVLDLNNESKNVEVQFLNALQLKRIGLYPDHAQQFAIFDYTIGEEITQYLLVVSTDQSGNFENLGIES